ncbi:MAG: nuclear transport factor 2 family protein [Candidatus Binatia bacterium]
MSVENNELRILLDKHACQEVLTRYCRAMDWLDVEALREVFAADAEVDYGFFRSRGNECIAILMDVEKSFLRRWHLIANAIVQVSGDTAEGESYGLAAGVSSRDGHEVTDVFGGRYLDCFARRAGKWQITKRLYVLDWQRSFTDDGAAEPLPGITWSSGFNPDHPLYRKL